MENTNMAEIELALKQIHRDLNLIKRRLSIADSDPALVSDQDQDQDQDPDQYRSIILDLDLDPDQYDLEKASRSLAYFVSNQWRIKNQKGYLEKALTKYPKRNRSDDAIIHQSVEGVPYEYIRKKEGAFSMDLVKRVRENCPGQAHLLPALDDACGLPANRRLVLALAINGGLL